LLINPEAAQLQFMDETTLINAFQQPRAFVAMNLHRSTDDGLCDGFGL
jgi:hypothetical protein